MDFTPHGLRPIEWTSTARGNDARYRQREHPHGRTIKGEAEFVNYSFDVKAEGQNVPRLGDMMVQDKQSSPNTPPSPRYSLRPPPW